MQAFIQALLSQAVSPQRFSFFTVSMRYFSVILVATYQFWACLIWAPILKVYKDICRTKNKFFVKHDI